MSMSTLSDDVLREIFLHLPVLERIRIRPVCRKWRRVSDDCWRNVKQLYVHSRCYESTKDELQGDSTFLDILSTNEQFILGFMYRAAEYIEYFYEEPDALHFSIVQGLEKCRKLKSLVITARLKSDHRYLRRVLTANQRIRVLDVTIQSDTCLSSMSTEFLEELTIRTVYSLGAITWDKLRQCRLIKKLDTDGYIDDGIAEIIGGLQNLKSLTVDLVSPKAANHIATLCNLERLEISDARDSITNEFCRKLGRNCVNLREFRIAYTSVTDEDLQCLSVLPHLQQLDIYRADRITGACLKYFAGVLSLSVAFAPVVDEHAIPLFRNSSRLRRLHLCNTQITVDALHVVLEEVLKREDNEATKDNKLLLVMDHLSEFIGPLPRLIVTRRRFY